MNIHLKLFMNKLPIAFDKYMEHGFKLTDTEKSFLQKNKDTFSNAFT